MNVRSFERPRPPRTRTGSYRTRNAVRRIIRDTNMFLNTNEYQRFRIQFQLGILNQQQVLQNIANILHNYTLNNNLVLEAGGRYITIQQENIRNIEQVINNYLIQPLDTQYSDQELIYNIINSNELILHKVINERRRQGGRFFNYFNTTSFDLSSLDIYKDINETKYDEACFIKCLKETKIVSEEQIENFKTKVLNDKIPKANLNIVCDILKINIKLTHIYKNKDTKTFNYYGIKNKKKVYEKILDICLFEEHYFVKKELPITSYAIKNYNEIKDLKEFNKIYKKTKDNKYKKSNKRFLSSNIIVKLMYNNNLFKPITYNDLLKTQFYDKSNNEITTLIDDKDNYKKIEIKKNNKKNKKEYKIIFFDFETYTNKNNEHKPYLCCSIDENNNKKTFYGYNCGKQLLESLNSNTCLIAHNSAYDINFLMKYFSYTTSIIKKGSNVIYLTAKYQDIEILIKDSLCLIPMPLRSFGKTFNLKQGKEVISYNSYNDYFNNKEKYPYKLYPIKNILEEFKDNKEKQKIFLENIEKWKLKVGDFFKLIEYSKEYCLIDCQVLKEGYLTFKEWILNICNIDINEVITLASLADKYLINEGCYNGCYTITGVPREFIQKCVIGGRCMTNNNIKYKLNNVKIADFDAVSLYPSAMYRLNGFLKGIPKVLKDNELNYNFLKKQDGYFVEIKIKKINIKRGFSLISKIDEKSGVRNFHNEYEEKNIFVDKITLEDLINFQNINFKVIRGYYFNEGFNTKIKEKIKYIFDERLRMKKLKNPIQLVYKLLMNSSYGKTILKPIEDEMIVKKSKEEAMKFIKFNYNYIKEYYKVDNSEQWIIKKKKSLLEHFSRPHIGVEILSMSKRIMNEVMTTAEDNNIMIYYQDTDSMHINMEEIHKLQKLYNQKYNRELIGKNMGQFHSDFDLNGATKNIYATDSIFLGKKCYIDCLRGENDNNEVINGYHCRMKGVPNSTIKYTCDKLNINELELYEKLYNGEKISFDLLEGGLRVQFKFNKDFTVNSESNFIRALSF